MGKNGVILGCTYVCVCVCVCVEVLFNHSPDVVLLYIPQFCLIQARQTQNQRLCVFACVLVDMWVYIKAVLATVEILICGFLFLLLLNMGFCCCICSTYS